MGRLQNPNALPLGIAIQAVALFVAAMFMTPSSTSSPESTGVGGSTGENEAVSSLTQLPRDLQREMLPVARVPERENRNEPPTPQPVDDGADSLQSNGPKLASLRIQNVALAGLVATPISAPTLGVPDNLDGQSLANGGWLAGSSDSARRRGARSGGGGTTGIGGGGMGGGIGGGGGGGGGYCPAPGGGGGGRGGSPGRGRSR